jgi:hypothetical protein
MGASRHIRCSHLFAQTAVRICVRLQDQCILKTDAYSCPRPGPERLKLWPHAGEVALPGGKQDQIDVDEVAAALREAREEVGLGPDNVEVLTTCEPFLSKVKISSLAWQLQSTRPMLSPYEAL